MIGLNNIKNSGGFTPSELEIGLQEFYQNRKSNFSKNGLSTNSIAYQICIDCGEGELSKQIIDPISEKLLARCAGVSLYVDQVRRRENPYYIFDNESEIMEMNEYVESLSNNKNSSRVLGYAKGCLNEVLGIPEILKSKLEDSTPNAKYK